VIDRIQEIYLHQRAVVRPGTVALLGVGLWSTFHVSLDAGPDSLGFSLYRKSLVSL